MTDYYRGTGRWAEAFLQLAAQSGGAKTATEVALERDRFNNMVMSLFRDHAGWDNDGNRAMYPWEFYCAMCEVFGMDP